MTITFTSDELAKWGRELSDWYNGMTMFVLTNMAQNARLMDFSGGGVRAAEDFHKWAKRYQEEHPKPSWKDLLPE